MRRLLWIVAGLLTALALCIVLVTVLAFDSVTLWLMRPSDSFSPAALPSAPNYSLAAHWSALPGQVHTADVALPALPAAEPAAARADVFYVHPTSYVGSKWNGPIDDATLNADTDRVATRLQASAFNGCCAVYAPRYRQVNGMFFTHPSSDGELAADIAYHDVAEAFRYYLATYNRGRPFFIAAHSQGTVMAQRLLREEITGKPTRTRLIAAYLIGGPIYKDIAARELPDIPVCDTPEQTGCLISWNARAPKYRPGTFEFRVSGAPANGALVCVNPLTWRQDEAKAEAAQNEGALFWEERAPQIRPGFADAQCQNGTLVITHLEKPPRDFMSRLLDRALGPGNYHPIEYQIFFVSLRKNAELRLAAFLRRQAATQ